MDEKIRRLYRAAAEGDVDAGVELAYALMRRGVLPETRREWWARSSSTSLIPAPSYVVTLPESERSTYSVGNGVIQLDPVDLCMVPVGPEAIYVIVGPGESHYQREGGYPVARAPKTISAAARGYQGTSWQQPYIPCEGARGPVYISPGGKRYELAAYGSFNLHEQGHWAGAARLYYHFVGSGRRPPGYQRVSDAVGRMMLNRVRRAVNAWAEDNPTAFETPVRGVHLTILSRTLQDLHNTQRRVEEIRERLAQQAVTAAEGLS